MLREEMERIVTQHIRDRESHTKNQVRKNNNTNDYGIDQESKENKLLMS